MNKRKLSLILFLGVVVSLCGYTQTPSPVPLPDEYICHVSCDGIPEGVKVRYSGDYEGTAVTPFDIGPYPEPFRVVLEPTAIDIRTSDYDGLYTMGWQWTANENPYPFGKLHITVETRSFSPEVSAAIRYVSYSSPTIEPGPTPVSSAPESTKAPPPFWDNVTIAGLIFIKSEYNPEKMTVGFQIYSTIARPLDWGTPVHSGTDITIDTQLIEWKGPCPQEETWLYHIYDLGDLVIGEEYTLTIKGWGYEMGSCTFIYDEPVPTPSAHPEPPWEVCNDPNITIRYKTVGGITSAGVTMLFIENETTLYSFNGWGLLQKSGNSFSLEPDIIQNKEAEAAVKVKYYSNTFTLGALPSGTYTIRIKPMNSNDVFIDEFTVDAEQTPAPPTPSPTPWREPFVELTLSEEEVIYPYDDTFTVDLENLGGECEFRLLDTSPTGRVHYDITQGYLTTGDMVTITGTVDWSKFSTDAGYGYYQTVEISAPGYVQDIRFYIVLNYNVPTITPSVSPISTPTPTTDPGITPTPTPTMTPGPYKMPGYVWFYPEDITVPFDTDFTTELHINSGTQLIAAYGIKMTFDPALITVNLATGTYGVDAGPDGYIATASVPNPGILMISGFDATGTGPGPDLHLVTIHWTSYLEPGSTDIVLVIDELIAPDYETIGTPAGVNGNVTVVEIIRGDTNGDGIIDIIDALLTAQYYVGLDPQGFNPQAADANCDGMADIVDALLLAQYYVGLITELC